MGIAKFRGHWLLKRLREKNIRGVSLDRLPKNVATLSLDLNGSIYEAAAIVYGLGDVNLQDYNLEFKAMNESTKMNTVFKILSELIKEIVLTIAPSNMVIISIDGPTCLAKAKQQRSRRFRASCHQHSDDPDVCQITPGTPFMSSLNSYLKEWLTTNRHLFPINLIYSSHLDPGEGEHKIMNFFRKDLIKTDGPNVIYGLDGDFIILSLLSPLKNIYLVGEDYESVLSIEALKRMLISEAPIELKESVIPDFCALMSLIGNDFVPHGPTQMSMYIIVETMLNTYYQKGIPITYVTQEQGVRYINYKAMAPIVSTMANVQATSMVHEANKRLLNPENYYPSFYDSIAINDSGDLYDWENFRSAWYSREFYRDTKGIPGFSGTVTTKDKIVGMCNNYMEGMSWVFRYYQTNKIDPYWYYSYNRSPLYVDLAVVLDNSAQFTGRELNISFFNQDPLPWGALEQLLMVIPFSHKHHLPKFIQHVYEGVNDYSDMFPRNCIVELDGIMKKSASYRGDEHLAISIVPPFDIDRILNITKGLEKYKAGFDPERTTLYKYNTKDLQSRYMKVSGDERLKYENKMNRRNNKVKRKKNEHQSERKIALQKKIIDWNSNKRKY